MAVVLLIGAGLLIRSLAALQNVNPGFDAHNVLTMRIDLPRQKYNSPEKAGNFFKELETRVGGLPGVEAAGFVTELPLSGQPNDINFTIEGRPPVSPDQEFGADFRRINQNYFSAMRIPLLRGRNFTEQEVDHGGKVVIISQQIVDTVFPNEEPLGKRLITFNNEPFEIVGVVGDLLHRSLGAQPVAAMYFPRLQNGGTNLVLRTTGDPLSLAGAVRNEVRAIDPDQPIANVRPMTSGSNLQSPSRAIAQPCSRCLRRWR